MIAIKRIYEDPSEQDGYRLLVDRIWPRGVSKEKAKLDEWMKDVAPQDKLRKWFNHDPEKWPAFRKKYKSELKEKTTTLKKLKSIEKEHRKITLLFAAKSEAFNQAVVLKEVLDANALGHSGEAH